MATLLLPGTVAKVLSFLQSIYSCRSVAFFNFAYFQPDFIKVQAHYLYCMAMEPRTGILTLWSLHWCLSLITTDKGEEIWNQLMFSHFSNMILKVGRKHELRLRTHARCDQFMEHKLQLPTYATSLSLPIGAGCPSGFRHTCLDPGHLGTHLPYTWHMPPSPWPPPSLTFILSLPRHQWPHICTLRGIMLIDLNQVLQEAAPKRQVLTYMLCTRMLNHFVDCYLLDSSVHGILQTRILEWVACPPPGDLPNQGIKPESLESPVSLALAGGFFTTSITWEAQHIT